MTEPSDRSDRGAVRLVPWGDGDLPLLEQLVGDPAMMEHLGGYDFEYPPGSFMRCDDWRMALLESR